MISLVFFDERSCEIGCMPEDLFVCGSICVVLAVHTTVQLDD